MLTEKRPLIALVFWLRRTFPLPLLRQGQDCAKYSEDRGLKKRGRKISVGADYADILLFYIIPVGGINWGMKAYERGYLRARAGISADKDGDICGQGRRYLRTKAEISTRKAAQGTDR